MRKLISIVLACCACVSAGCKGMISAENTVGTMKHIYWRHKHYITADSTLTELESRVAIRNLELVRAIYEEALEDSLAFSME